MTALTDLLVGYPPLFVLFIIVATLFFLPGSIAMMLGGFLFGFLPGLLLTAIAIPLGAQAAFEAGRWVARPWVLRKVADNPKMHAIELALKEEAFLIVVLTRLSLVIPFNVLNYAYGATSVRASTHLIATAVGMLPAVGLYVYLGSLARNVEQIMAGEAAPSELGYWLAGVSVIAIIIASWLIHRTANRVLERHLKQ